MSTAIQNVNEWLISCYDRFENMYNADLDKNGLPAIQKAIKHFSETGQFSVGEFQYLFNRSSSLGALPKYNTHKGYDKRYGVMKECPLADIISTGLVNWPSGKNGIIQPHLANAIRTLTKWEYRMGDLRVKNNTTYADIFG